MCSGGGGALHAQTPRKFFLADPVQSVASLRDFDRRGPKTSFTLIIHYTEIEKADAVLYGMGSLYTSICPTVCLEGMGEAIAARPVPKVRTRLGI